MFWKVPRKGNADLSRCIRAATDSTLASEMEGNVLPPIHLVYGNISADLSYFFISEKAFYKNIAFPFPVARLLLFPALVCSPCRRLHTNVAHMHKLVWLRLGWAARMPLGGPARAVLLAGLARPWWLALAQFQ